MVWLLEYMDAGMRLGDLNQGQKGQNATKRSTSHGFVTQNDGDTGYLLVETS